MVLFITGLCERNCFYCPVSLEKRKDVVFANERQVKNDEDIIQEAYLMHALGTGITGGEPLLRLQRVLHYICLLKNRFGKKHHIHLYTGLAPDKKILESLKDAGLDEIRFHPPLNLWKDIANTAYKNSILTAHRLGISTGIEVPAIPADYNNIISLLEEVKGFLNLNELEFSETNAHKLKKLGYKLNEDSFSALGSKEIAKSLHYNKLHFCSSVFKDAVQLRERLKRIAKNTARDFDEITEDGTLVYGVIEGKESENILKENGVGYEMYSVRNDVIETSWWIVHELSDKLKKAGCRVWIEERYPRIDGMIVERTPV